MNERPTESARTRVLLAEDHPASADLLRALLQPEFDVVASVRDGRALLTAAAALAPDVIVTDIGMPCVNGLEAAREILRRNPDARVVFVTVDSSPEVVQRGLDHGRARLRVEAGGGRRPGARRSTRHCVAALCQRIAAARSLVIVGVRV